MSKLNNYSEIKNLCNEFYIELEKLVTKTFSQYLTLDKIYIEDLKNYICGSSKQIRSCLIFLFAQNFGYNADDKDIIKLAAAVEIIHNATLIHDDIIDKSDIRRGNFTLHKKYSNKLGVISGDFLLSLALNLLLELPATIMKNFAICINSLCLGEINQYFSLKTTPTLKQYLKKSEQKTSSLFIAALKSLIEIKNLDYVNNIETFATHFGRAFQIKDDLKNIYSKSEKKPVLNDIENGIYTLPVILAYGENINLTQNSVDEIIKNSNNELIIKKTTKLLNDEISSAINCLEQFPENKYKKAIVKICELLNIV